jgi:hypothetical protein
MSDADAHCILTALERLETKQDGFEATLDKMGTDIMAMRAAVMDRIDRLQHKVDQTHDALVVNFGNTDRVERVARAAVDDGRTTTEILRVMQRQNMRLETDVEQLKGAS